MLFDKSVALKLQNKSDEEPQEVPDNYFLYVESQFNVDLGVATTATATCSTHSTERSTELPAAQDDSDNRRTTLPVTQAPSPDNSDNRKPEFEKNDIRTHQHAF